MAGRTVSVKISADTSSFVANMAKAAASAEAMAKKSESAGKSVDTAATKIAVSQARVRVATANVQKATEDLNKVRQNAKSTDEQLVTAADKHASAQKHLAKVQDDVRQSSLGLTATIEKNAAAYDKVGGALTKFGAVGAASLLAVGKAAMDWESQWAGVTKTVSGSSAELNALEGSLRNMAKTMPTTHADIAAVAEAAGQLGVKTADVTGFTKVMVELGDTTNLSADEAATSLAQFMNVMGTSGKDVERLGSTIVGLGNAGASTERDIVQMGQRIAGAGRQIGLSETEVLGFSNALASVGIDAEAGGTAISTTFLKIDGAVRSGGRGLDALAKTAGMTGEEFKTAFRDDAAGATTAFISGLGDVQKAGGDTTAILKTLGITGIRESDALRRLGSSGTLLADSLKTGNEAWKQNTALAVEAGKRYETTESKIKIAWNNIKDAAISAGGDILPVAAGIAENISKVAAAFGELPEGAQSNIIKIAAGLTALALAAGGALKVATSVASMATAMKSLSSAAPGAATGVSKFGKAAGGAALGIGIYATAVSAMLATNDKAESYRSVQEITSALGALSSAGPAAGAALDDIFKKRDGSAVSGQAADLGSALESTFNPALAVKISNVGEKIATLGGTIARTQADKTADQFRSLDDALGGLSAGGKADEAAAAFSQIAAKANDLGIATVDLVDKFPAYRDALLKQAEAAGVAGLSAEELARWMGGEVPVAMQKAGSALVAAGDNAGAAGTQFGALVGAQNDLELATKNLGVEQEKVIKNFSVLNAGAQDAESANSGWEASLDSLAQATKDAGAAEAGNTAARTAATKATRDVQAAELRLKELRDGGKASASSILSAENSLKSARERLDVANAKVSGSTSKVSKSLDIGTEAGRKNREAITSAIRALDAKTKADFDNNVSQYGMEKATKIATKALGTGEKQIREAAKAAGFNKGEVDKMIKSMLKTPDELKTDVSTPGLTKAQDMIKELERRIKELESKQINITAKFGIQADKAVESLNKSIISKYGKGAKTISFRAAGGAVWGEGTGTSDDIPAMLSNGEYVVKAKSVQKMGLSRLDHINTHGEDRRYANGGLVQRNISVQGRGNTPPPVGSMFNAHASAFEKGATDYMAGLSKAFANAMNDTVDQAEASFDAASAGRYGGSNFSAEQLRNAAAIASVGSGMGSQAIKIALMTAMQESTLRNLSGGDRDSVGLFQQRAPWGSFGTRHNPAASARMFFHGGQGGQPGLDDIRGWQGMSLGQAAQRVQVSAFPGAYAKWADEAQAIMGGMGSGSTSFGKIDTKNPRGRTTFRGKTFSNLFAAGLRKSEQDAGATLQIFQGGFRPQTSYSGTSHRGDAIDATVNNSLIRALRKNGIPTWDRTGKGNWVSHMHGVPLPGAGFPAGSAVWQGQDYLRGGDGLGGRDSGPRPARAKRIGSSGSGSKAGSTNGGKVASAYANGGHVRGPGTGTSDSIYTRLSNGEFVVRASAVDAFGVDKLHTINKMGGAQAPAAMGGFAAGGLAGVPAPVLALIRSLEVPLKDLAKAMAAVAAADKVKRAEDAKVRNPKAALDRAAGRYNDARDDKADATDKVNRLKKAADATKGTTKADRDLKKARQALAEVNARVTRTSKEKTDATAAYNKVAGNAKIAAEKLKDAQAALLEQNKALAEQVQSESKAFRDAYQSKSTDANDWIQLMKDGAADIGTFNAKIVALRKAGLSETLVQQIIGMGAVAGTDIAAQIAKGGKGMVAALNKANQGIQDAADTLGYTSATGVVRKAAGGWVMGPGTATSDSIRMLASNGEYVIPASDAAAVKSGRKIIDRNYVQGNRYGGYVSTPTAQQGQGAGGVQVSIAQMNGGDPFAVAKAIDARRRDNLALSGMSMGA